MSAGQYIAAVRRTFQLSESTVRTIKKNKASIQESDLKNGKGLGLEVMRAVTERSRTCLSETDNKNGVYQRKKVQQLSSEHVIRNVQIKRDSAWADISAQV